MSSHILKAKGPISPTGYEPGFCAYFIPDSSLALRRRPSRPVAAATAHTPEARAQTSLYTDDQVVSRAGETPSTLNKLTSLVLYP